MQSSLNGELKGVVDSGNSNELKRIDNELARLARIAKREKSINDGKEHQRRKTNNTTTKTG
jgi:hypothetical protein